MSNPIGRLPSDWRSPSGRFRIPPIGGPSAEFGRRGARPLVVLVTECPDVAERLSRELASAGFDVTNTDGAGELARVASPARTIVVDLEGLAPERAEALVRAITEALPRRSA